MVSHHVKFVNNGQFLLKSGWDAEQASFDFGHYMSTSSSSDAALYKIK